MTEDTAPERIWAIETTEETNTPDPNRYGVWDTEQDGQEGETEYVRKDLFDAARLSEAEMRGTLSALESANEALDAEVKRAVVKLDAARKVKPLPRQHGQKLGWKLPPDLLLEIQQEVTNDGWDTCMEVVETVALSVERRILSALDQGGAV